MFGSFSVVILLTFFQVKRGVTYNLLMLATYKLKLQKYGASNLIKKNGVCFQHPNRKALNTKDRPNFVQNFVQTICTKFQNMLVNIYELLCKILKIVKAISKWRNDGSAGAVSAGESPNDSIELKRQNFEDEELARARKYAELKLLEVSINT